MSDTSHPQLLEARQNLQQLIQVEVRRFAHREVVLVDLLVLALIVYHLLVRLSEPRDCAHPQGPDMASLSRVPLSLRARQRAAEPRRLLRSLQ